jgi:hypothetical protein
MCNLKQILLNLSSQWQLEIYSQYLFELIILYFNHLNEISYEIHLNLMLSSYFILT